MTDKDILARLTAIKGILYEAPDSLESELGGSMSGSAFAQLGFYAGKMDAVTAIAYEEVAQLCTDIKADIIESERSLKEWREEQEKKRQDEKKKAFVQTFALEGNQLRTDPKGGGADAE